MNRGFFLDVVVLECASVFELFAGKDETLLVGRNAFFILYFLFDAFDRVVGFYIKGNRLTRKGFYEDLHGCCNAIEEG